MDEAVKKAKRILFVEDDRDLIDVVTVRLRVAGYEVTACHDGESALKEVKRQRPDLLVLDVFLPVIDGYSVLRAVKEHLQKTEGKDDMPVIIITGRGSLMKDMFKLEGVREFLQKPFEAERLVELAKQFVG